MYRACAASRQKYITFYSELRMLFSWQPSTLVSPTTVLRSQKGNCFDFSVLLSSLLIGAGYDAYCVCGYATRETTLMDETREICPLLRKKDEVCFLFFAFLAFLAKINQKKMQDLTVAVLHSYLTTCNSVNMIECPSEKCFIAVIYLPTFSEL